ncbi:hypothetical protein AB0B42_21095, partial [Streptomyces fradiae]|uniref:hypothetical protein n=1 Tax=Streptomyces fradiae TaxID=1906 RepID=UPI003476FF24
PIGPVTATAHAVSSTDSSTAVSRTRPGGDVARPGRGARPACRPDGVGRDRPTCGRGRGV